MPADLPTLRAQVEEARSALAHAQGVYTACVGTSRHRESVDKLESAIDAYAAAVRRLARAETIAECVEIVDEDVEGEYFISRSEAVAALDALAREGE